MIKRINFIRVILRFLVNDLLIKRFIKSDKNVLNIIYLVEL